MRCILWGTDKEVETAKSLLRQMGKHTDIIATGLDCENYAYHPSGHSFKMTAADIIRLKEMADADAVLLASPIRYAETEYRQLRELGATGPIYIVPSYLYRKKALDQADKSAIFTPFGQLPPQLYYLEYHAADHCNLNCRGCTHFSNIVSGKAFPDLGELEKSISRLRTLFQNIEFIRILGGEPLLNPQLHTILDLTRNGFPYSKIILVTNGLAIRDIPEHLVQSIRRNDVQITISVYPPLVPQIKAIEHFLAEKGISVQFGEKQDHYRICDEFTKFIDKNGRQDKEDSWSHCRRKRCSFLHQGKLYGCALPALAPYYNKYFHTDLPSSDGIDIFDRKLDGYAIQKELQKPMHMCSYCGKEQKFRWSTTTGNANESDWCIE